MSERTKTTLEVRAEIGDIMNKLAVLDNKLEDTLEQAVQGTHSMGAGFTMAGQQAQGAGKIMADGSNQAAYALTNLNWLVSDSPYLFQNMRMGIMSVSNNINPLMNGFVLLKKHVGSNKAVFKALISQLTGPAGIATALTAVIAIVQIVSIVMAKHKAKTEGATEANKEFAKSLKQIQKETNTDSLRDQIDQSINLINISEQRIIKLKEENEQFKLNEDRMKTLQKASKNLGYAFDAEGQLMSFKAIDKELKGMIDDFKRIHPEADLKKYNAKSILKFYEKQGKENERIIKQEETSNKLRKDQIDLNNKAGIPSEKELRYKERLFELETGRLPVEQQIAAWEAEKAKFISEAKEGDEKTVEYKEKILDYNEHIAKATAAQEKLQSEISELQEKELEGDEKIAALKELQSGLNRSKLEDEKEYLTIQKEIDKIENASAKTRDEAQRKYEQLGIDTGSRKYLQERINAIQAQVDAEAVGTERRKELETELYNFKIGLWEKEQEHLEEMRQEEEQYTQNLAGLISDGGLEAVYEDMFSRLKQSLIQSALDRLGITRFMMNAEQMIITAGEQGIDGIRNLFHKKEQVRQVEETTGAAVASGAKGVESASGIPFPGNIAAIGIVLASIFSSLRKSKATGTQIYAAAEGLVVNKPTLALVGEAINKSGPEIIVPQNNFNRYMEKQVIPGIMSKVNVNNSGLEKRMERVENAIYSIGRQIPNETGKAVTKAMRGKF